MPGIDLSKCVLITGATAGIGRALAYKIKDLPNKPQVIAAGRRQDRLDELAKDGFETVKLDVGADRVQLKKDVELLLVKYPDVCHSPKLLYNCFQRICSWIPSSSTPGYRESSTSRRKLILTVSILLTWHATIFI